MKPQRWIRHLANNRLNPFVIRSSLLSKRPLCSDRERLRGDTEVWGPNGENSVGLLQDVGLRVRYTYDRCFDGTRTNQQASRMGSWQRHGGVSSELLFGHHSLSRLTTA